MTAVAISCGIGGGARRSGREILDYALLGFLSFSVAAAIVMFIVGVMGYRAKMFQQESYRRWLQASQQIGLASFVGFLIAVGALTVYYLTEYVECLFL